MLAPQRSDQPPRVLLRFRDQSTIAALTALAAVTLLVYWLFSGGLSGRLVEIDRQPRRSIEFQVDLNTADWPELAQLPGVGETLARRIVQRRNTHGPFVSIDELQLVNGVGPKTLQAIQPYLRPLDDPAL